MVQIVKEGSIELVNNAKPEAYWLRNKKPKVNFYHDTPFAVDRQLEDQRLLMERNKNPQLQVFTKVDKLRSDKISAKQGITRSVAMKANVVNKIVREASGVHNYTIIAPPRSITNPDGKMPKERLEPETNPKVKSYANESKAKPIVCSFGHRPRSASRTFHPSSMRFRLRPGEILPSVGGSSPSKSGPSKVIGLSVAVLAKVLHAPAIKKLDELLEDSTDTMKKEKDGKGYSRRNDYEFREEDEDDEEVEVYHDDYDDEEYAKGVNLEDSTLTGQRNHHHSSSGFDYEGLFFTKDQQKEMLYNIERHESVYGVRKNKRKKGNIKLKPLNRSSSSGGKQRDQKEGSLLFGEDSWITSSSNIKVAKSTLSMLPPVRSSLFRFFRFLPVVFSSSEIMMIVNHGMKHFIVTLQHQIKYLN
jgi:hypothetical protein